MSLFCNMGILQHGKIEEVLMYVNEEPNRLRLVVGWIVDVVVVISIAWFVVFALGTQITVTGQSMEPAFVQRETVLMNRLSYMITGPDRMDIVAFEKEEGKYNIKRVVGLPGETVQIQGGLLYIDGEPLEVSGKFETADLAGLAEHPVVLKKDEYFLLGDNRENSEDSRFSAVGNVKRRQIKGKIWLRIRPARRFGLIHS